MDTTEEEQQSTCDHYDIDDFTCLDCVKDIVTGKQIGRAHV